MNEEQIRKIIEEELRKFKEKNLGFRSWLRLDTPTDTYTVANKNTSGSYLPLTGGTIAGNLITTGSTKMNTVGFYNTTPQSKQTVSGSRGANAALASLLTALATVGLITDSSS